MVGGCEAGRGRYVLEDLRLEGEERVGGMRRSRAKLATASRGALRAEGRSRVWAAGGRRMEKVAPG